MSAHTCLVFYGVKSQSGDKNQFFNYRREAEEHSLDTWETGGDSPDEKDTIFVGRIIAVIGREHDKYHALETGELEKIIKQTHEQLRVANLVEGVSLHTVLV